MGRINNIKYVEILKKGILSIFSGGTQVPPNIRFIRTIVDLSHCENDPGLVGTTWQPYASMAQLLITHEPIRTDLVLNRAVLRRSRESASR